jgi:hypothetical protein
MNVRPAVFFAGDRSSQSAVVFVSDRSRTFISTSGTCICPAASGMTTDLSDRVILAALGFSCFRFAGHRNGCVRRHSIARDSPVAAGFSSPAIRSRVFDDSVEVVVTLQKPRTPHSSALQRIRRQAPGLSTAFGVERRPVSGSAPFQRFFSHR